MLPIWPDSSQDLKLLSFYYNALKTIIRSNIDPRRSNIDPMNQFQICYNIEHFFLVKKIYISKNRNDVKGTRCLGSVELVFKKRSVTVCYKMHLGRYNDPHKHASKCTVFLLPIVD